MHYNVLFPNPNAAELAQKIGHSGQGGPPNSSAIDPEQAFAKQLSKLVSVQDAAPGTAVKGVTSPFAMGIDSSQKPYEEWPDSPPDGPSMIIEHMAQQSIPMLSSRR